MADMNVGWVGIAAADLNATLYWSQPFRPLASSKALCEYIVLDGESTGLSNGRVRPPLVRWVRGMPFLSEREELTRLVWRMDVLVVAGG